MFSCKFCEIFKNTFFTDPSEGLLLNIYHVGKCLFKVHNNDTIVSSVDFFLVSVLLPLRRFFPSVARQGNNVQSSSS